MNTNFNIINIKSIILLTFFALINCSSVEYKDPDKYKEGTTQWGPVEIKQTVNKMTDSLESFLESRGKKDILEVEKIQNRSSEHIDTKILGNEISTNLYNKKIRFVDRSVREDAMKEIANGQRGLISEKSILQAGNFQSPKYRLQGEINDTVNFHNGKKIHYILITLKLVNLETNTIDWQDIKKFLKESEIEGFGL